MGTLAVRSEGQIHQIDFEDDTNQINRRIYKPKVGEIWQVQAAPTGRSLGLVYNQISGMYCHLAEPEFFSYTDLLRKVSKRIISTMLFFLILDGSSQMKCGIWQLPEDSEGVVEGDLDPVISLEDPEIMDNVQSLDWHTRKPECLSVAYENSFVVWDVGGGLCKVSQGNLSKHAKTT